MITFADVTTPGTCAGNFVITRTWTATDECGNTSTCVQTITVQDITAPVITCPADVIINCEDPSTPAATGTATATDNCDAAPVITFADVTTPGSCAGNYTITRTWTATDNCGNTSTCVQTITVQDITAPVITCPADVVINCEDPSTPAATGIATATDNCDAAPVITFADVTTPGSCAGNFAITRTWTATDKCGNTSTCVQTITVQDITAPVITCPADVILNCEDPFSTCRYRFGADARPNMGCCKLGGKTEPNEETQNIFWWVASCGPCERLESGQRTGLNELPPTLCCTV